MWVGVYVIILGWIGLDLGNWTHVQLCATTCYAWWKKVYMLMYYHHDSNRTLSDVVWWCLKFGAVVVIWRRNTAEVATLSRSHIACRAVRTSSRCFKCASTGEAPRPWRCLTTDDELSRCRAAWRCTAVSAAIYRRQPPTHDVTLSLLLDIVAVLRHARRPLAAPSPASAPSKVSLTCNNHHKGSINIKHTKTVKNN